MTARLSRVGALGALVIVAAASLGTPFAATGCGTQCERNPNEAPVRYAEGTTTNAGTPFASYESSGWNGPYLDFPPGRTYRFVHGLGDCPKQITVYGSFNPAPVATDETSPPMGGSAQLVGNQGTIERVTPTAFEVRNDTCSGVFIRVEASDPGSSGCRPPVTGTAADAAPENDAAP